MGKRDEILGLFPELTQRDPKQVAPLALAYVGDTVYDLYVRTYLLLREERTPHALHMAAVQRVRAAGQTASYARIAGCLTPEEQAVFKRGRNAHSGTMPKNASSADYHTATGLEALIGYLYLQGNDARLGELMQIILREGESPRAQTDEAAQ